MNAFLKTTILMGSIALSACSAEVNAPANPFKAEEKIANQPLQGSIDGQTWKMEKALGQIQNDGSVTVIISGNGEQIDCGNIMPRNSFVLYSVPNKTAEYNFDLLAPENGYAVTFVRTDLPSGTINVVSDVNTVSMTAIADSSALGGLKAQFLDPANAGTLNGKFEIEVCP